mmetsp:Transcript_20776/g.53584  ORF Transcript_20776/g.53584 Transcript_20776/m.53584 type:complete len:205 (+) Transcript_20776:2041-2655(+)
MPDTALAALRKLGKDTIATAVVSGMCCTFSTTSVTMPSVPSAPTKIEVRSYPAELFFALCPVLTIVPSASTAVSDITFSRITPYLTAFGPLHPVDTIPPMVAPGPGSTPKKSPSFFSCSFNVCQPMPGSTTTSRSPLCTSFMLSIDEKEISKPPSAGRPCPSKAVRPPRGTTGKLCLLAIFTAAATSSVEVGYTMAVARTATVW